MKFGHQHKRQNLIPWSARLVLLLAPVASVFGPWWAAAIPALFFGIILRRPFLAFVTAVFVMFVSNAGWLAYYHFQANGRLTEKMAEVMQFSGDPMAMLATTALAFAAFPGIAAFAGGWMTATSRKRSPTSFNDGLAISHLLRR